MTKTLAAPFKSPLVQAFGLLIKKARKKEQKSSADLAAALGISASLLRLIESGAATLQPNKSIELIKALPNIPIEFRQLSVLVVACLISESRGSIAEELPHVISNLIELDQGLGVAIRPLAESWANLLAESDYRRRAEIIEELAMPERLLEFLSQKTDPTTEAITSAAKLWGHKLVEGTPPIYLDLVETIVTELKRFPPKITALEMNEWEKSLIGRFRRIYAVLKTLRAIPETYEEFDWRSIADTGLLIVSMSDVRYKRREQKSFEQFLEKLKKEDWIKATGKSVKEICKLRFAYEKNGYPQQFAQIKSEQQIRVLSARAAQSVRWKKIEANKSRTDFKNAWVYEVVPRTLPLSGVGYHVAFIDDLDVDADSNFDVRVCSWIETERWVKLLRSFWSD